MDTIVKKYVTKPKTKQRDEVQKISESIYITQQQINAVEKNSDDLKFTNENQAVEIKKKQLQMLQKRKDAIENQDRLAGKKFRKINLNFLEKTKRRNVEGRIEGKDIKLTVKTPLYSAHRLYNQSGRYTFKHCEIRLNMTGGKVTYVDIISLRDSPLISKIYKSIYNTKSIYFNYIRYGIACVLDRDIRIFLKDEFSGLIPTKVKKETVEAYEMFDEVFLIKEANWQIEVIEKDPLIIGILDEEAYLVSHFDCTPFEHYVKSEF